MCYLLPDHIRFFTFFYFEAVWVSGKSELSFFFFLLVEKNWLVRLVLSSHTWNTIYIYIYIYIYISLVLHGILISVQLWDLCNQLVILEYWNFYFIVLDWTDLSCDFCHNTKVFHVIFLCFYLVFFCLVLAWFILFLYCLALFYLIGI